MVVQLWFVSRLYMGWTPVIQWVMSYFQSMVSAPICKLFANGITIWLMVSNWFLQNSYQFLVIGKAWQSHLHSPTRRIWVSQIWLGEKKLDSVIRHTILLSCFSKLEWILLDADMRIHREVEMCRPSFAVGTEHPAKAILGVNYRVTGFEFRPSKKGVKPQIWMLFGLQVHVGSSVVYSYIISYIHTVVYVYIPMYIMYIYLYTSYIYIYSISIYTYIAICTHVHNMYIYIHVCIYIYMYTYTCI